MLSLLLDQHISTEVAEQVRAKRPEISIRSLFEWREGAFVGIADPLILRAAAQESLTLVTYDRKSIPPVLVEWGTSGISHGGVLFVDNLTIRSNDYGGLVRALIYYWDQEQASDWKDRIGFLPASTTTIPGCRPARSAGEPGATSLIKAPSAGILALWAKRGSTF